MYPRRPGTHFDLDYDINKHVPLCVKLLAKGLRKTGAEAAVAGTVPGQPTAYYGGCQFHYHSIEAFAAVWEVASAEIVADIPNYTDTAPVIQFNEIEFSG